jgi:hypothetical protein
LISGFGVSGSFSDNANATVAIVTGATSLGDLFTDGTLVLGSSNAEKARLTATTGNLLIGGTTDISGSGGLKVFGTTTATSTTSGAFQCAGGGSFVKELVTGLGLWLVDGQTAPSATSGYAKIYVDTADGDLKVIFGDGTIKTISTDT